MKNGVILDLDGTLSDSYACLAASLKYVYTRLQAARIAAQDNPGETTQSPLLSGEPLWPISEDGIVVDPILAKHKADLKHAAARIPQISDLLYQLHQRKRMLAVISNKPAALSTRLVRNLGINSYLMGTYGPETPKEAKPHPGMIYRAMADLGMSPDAIVLIGDQALDVDMARAAGVSVALITTAIGRARCEQKEPDYVFDSWSEAVNIE